MGIGIALGGVAKGMESSRTLGQRDRALDIQNRALDIREKQAGQELLNQLRAQTNENIGAMLTEIDVVLKASHANNSPPEKIAETVDYMWGEVEAAATSIGRDMSGIKAGLDARLRMPPKSEKTRLLEDSDLESPYADLSPNQIASGIAGGRFVIRTNEQSGASEVMDLATGGLVSRDIPVGTEVPPFANTERPPASETVTPDLSVGVGPFGAIKNMANTIKDALTGEAWDPEALHAETALNDLATATSIALQETVPGKPNTTTLKMFEELAARPNKFTQGKARTKSRLSEMRGRLQMEIDRIQSVVLDRPREWKPNELQAAKKSQSQLRLFLEEYTGILDAWDGKKDRPPLDSFGKGKK